MLRVHCARLSLRRCGGPVGAGGVCAARASPLARWASSSHTVSRDELRAALRVLALADDATDDDIKCRFQRLAKTSHPDTRRGDETTSGDNIQCCVEAYRLLRQYSREERRMILSSSRTGDSDAEERARRAYEGRRRQGNNNGSKAEGIGERGRTAQFNKFQQRMEAMREDAPPWGVAEMRRKRRSQWLSVVFGSRQHLAQSAMDQIVNEYKQTGSVNTLNPARGCEYPPGTFAATSTVFSPAAGAKFMQMKRRAERAAVDYRLLVGVVAVALFIFMCVVYSTLSRQKVAREKYYREEGVEAITEKRGEEE